MTILAFVKLIRYTSFKVSIYPRALPLKSPPQDRLMKFEGSSTRGDLRSQEPEARIRIKNVEQGISNRRSEVCTLIFVVRCSIFFGSNELLLNSFGSRFIEQVSKWGQAPRSRHLYVRDFIRPEIRPRPRLERSADLVPIVTSIR